MHTRSFLCLFLLIAASCTARPARVLPSPTAISYPATWTPAPTFTPEPPTPTATLVIQSAPVASNVSPVNFRRYPYPAYSTIGLWADTTHLSKDALRALAPRVQLVSGPQAGDVRQINPRVIALTSLNTAGQADNLFQSAQAVSASYDGVLLEHAGTAVRADPLGTTDRLLSSVGNAFNARLIIADTFAWSDGAAFAEHSSDANTLLAHVDGACLCSFLRPSNAPMQTFKGEAEWKEDVDALATLSLSPKLIMLVATRFDKVSNQELGQLQPWFDYALASFLLGANGTRAYFSFQGLHADDYMAGSELTISLGYPIGGYYPSFGMYARHFQRGLVLVNAGEYPREMPFPRVYTTPFGEELTRVTLEPHTGKILLVKP
jgi:hypothetical protein